MINKFDGNVWSYYLICVCFYCSRSVGVDDDSMIGMGIVKCVKFFNRAVEI